LQKKSSSGDKPGEIVWIAGTGEWIVFFALAFKDAEVMGRFIGQLNL
jgi:hypothetical protein